MGGAHWKLWSPVQYIVGESAASIHLKDSKT